MQEADRALIADFMRLVVQDEVDNHALDLPGKTYLEDQAFRTRAEGTPLLFQVAVVCWDNAHTPDDRWITVKKWKKQPTPERLRNAQLKALAMPRFFKICSRCEARTNVGYMHDDEFCQSCAEKHLGVVY